MCHTENCLHYNIHIVWEQNYNKAPQSKLLNGDRSSINALQIEHSACWSIRLTTNKLNCDLVPLITITMIPHGFVKVFL